MKILSMMKKYLFACAIVACVLFAACGKEESAYNKYYVGSYQVTFRPSLSEGGVSLSPSTDLTANITIDYTASGDSLRLVVDSVGASAIGYADEEGLHVKNLQVTRSYNVEYGTEGMRPCNVTLNFVQFTIPRPISNGVDQQCKFIATTTGSAELALETHENLKLDSVVGSTVFLFKMLNDPYRYYPNDTTRFPPAYTAAL